MNLERFCVEMFSRGAFIKGWVRENGVEKISFHIPDSVDAQKVAMVLPAFKPKLLELVKRAFPEPMNDEEKDPPIRRSILLE